MERSAEIEAAVRDFYHAMNKGDVTAIAERIGGSVRMVGTDAEEWWGPDRADVLRVFTAQVEEMSGQVSLEPYDTEAWSEGTVGWCASKVRVVIGGEPSEARMTGVLRLEDGAWRIVQGHVSFGVPNAEAFPGQELPTS